MISRRNIRVKVMQTLYTTASTNTGAEDGNVARRILDEKLNQTLDLFTVCVLYTIRVAQYAQTDAANRSSKYLPTDEDRNVNVDISTNSFVAKVLGNKTFSEKVKTDKLERYIDRDQVKKIFQSLSKSESYEKYVAANSHTSADDKDIIREIWQDHMHPNEDLMGFFTDELPGWEDDAELIDMLMQNFFSGSSKTNFSRLLSEEKRLYAHDLLATSVEKSDYLLELIEPRLVNWDKDRVAVIDMLLLRMGVSELLYFPTIPTKVTINEYIDVAKQYSTPQSGQFINGVLDNILKQLVKEGKIDKQDRHK